MSGFAQQAGYLLHYTPWRDTSFIVDLFTLEHGRLGLVARGARSARPATRALYQPFRPLLVSWVGEGELLTLTGIEESGAALALDGVALASGYYLNELVLRLLGKEQPQPALFAHYALALASLEATSGAGPVGTGGASAAGVVGAGEGEGTRVGDGEGTGERTGERTGEGKGRSGRLIEETLRTFELQLLETVGVLPDLARCTADAAPVEAGRRYRFDPASAIATPLTDAAERPVYGIPKRRDAAEVREPDGARRRDAAGGRDGGGDEDDGIEVRGRTLLDLARLELDDATTREEGKRLMRALVARQLGGRPLRSRSMFEALVPPPPPVPSSGSGHDAGPSESAEPSPASGSGHDPGPPERPESPPTVSSSEPGRDPEPSDSVELHEPRARDGNV